VRIGIISDIHGNSSACRAIVPDLYKTVDLLFFLGDICGYYPFAEDCLSMFERERTICIRGNHDNYLLECMASDSYPSDSYESEYGPALRRVISNGMRKSDIEYMQSWPSSRSILLNSTTFCIYHGTPWNHLEGRVYPDFEHWEKFQNIPGDVILLGHTHYPMSKTIGRKILVNPGSAGQPRDGQLGACYAIFETDSGNVEFARRDYDPTPIIQDAQLHAPECTYLTKVLTPQ